MHLLTDFRYAARLLRKSPVFTVIAVASLALGLGSNTAIFSLLDQALLRPLPVSEPSELVAIESAQPIYPGFYSGDSADRLFTYPMYAGLRDGNAALERPPFAGIITRRRTPATISQTGAQNGSAEAEVIEAELVSGNFFDVLGVSPAAGRLLTQADDETKGGHPVVVLDHRYWTRRFGSDPGVVGETVRINSTFMTVIGVAPEGFYGAAFGPPADLYAPMMMKPQFTPAGDGLDDPRFHFLHLLARLSPGVTAEQATAAIGGVYHGLVDVELQAMDAGVLTADRREDYLSQPLMLYSAPAGVRTFQSQAGPVLYIMMGMVGLVLLAACANIASLLTARSFARQREVAIRLAVGASRGNLIRQFLAESILLSLLGAAVGLVVAMWTNQWILSVVGENGLLFSSSIDLRALVFALGVGVATGIVFGLLPALQATRPKINSVLKEQSAAAEGGRRQMFSKQAMVVAQVAVSMVLVVGTGLFAQSLANLRQIDSGLRVDDVAVFTLDASRSGYAGERAQQLYRDAEARIRALPGVTNAGLGNVVRLSGTNNNRGYRVEGYETAPGDNAIAWYEHISPGYLDTMEIPVLRGRNFGDQDRADTQPVVIVNQMFADRFFAGADPVGKRIGSTDALEFLVVGLVPDIAYESTRSEMHPQVFYPMSQEANLTNISVHVATSVPVATLMPAFRQSMAELDPQLPITGLSSMRTVVDEMLLPERLIADLCGACGVLAMLLAAIGLYGVTAFAVQRRTREIGIRMALGAEPGSVLRMVLKGVAKTAVLGVVIGIPGAIGLGVLGESWLFGVDSADVVTISAAALILLGASLTAGFLPANRAAHLDPMKTLRSE